MSKNVTRICRPIMFHVNYNLCTWTHCQANMCLGHFGTGGVNFITCEIATVVIVDTFLLNEDIHLHFASQGEANFRIWTSVSLTSRDIIYSKTPGSNGWFWWMFIAFCYQPSYNSLLPDLCMACQWVDPLGSEAWKLLKGFCIIWAIHFVFPKLI